MTEQKLMLIAMESIACGRTLACLDCVDELCEKPTAGPGIINEGGSSTQWRLEAQKMTIGHPIKCATFKHVDYFRNVFDTMQEAANYYNRHNQHMRPMGPATDWISDWDPTTKMRYVVRRQCRGLVGYLESF